MNLQAWATQQAKYSPARRGRFERGAALVQCALIQAAAQAVEVRRLAHRPAVESPAA